MRGPRVAIGWKGLDSIVLAEAGVEQLGDGLVRVPYRDASGAAWNHKVFAPSGRSWWQESGMGLLPFGLERVARPEHRDKRLLWIAEGESDALALRGEYAAWRNLPVDVIGLPGAGTWRDEWRKHVGGYRGVFVFPDGDGAGERMADRIADTVRHVIRVRLPAGRDVRSVLQEDGADALDEYLIRGEATLIMLAGLRLCRTPDELERFISEVEL